MRANDSNSCVDYLKKFVDEYSNAYHSFIAENQLIPIILLWVKKLNWVIKLLNLMSVIKAGLLNPKKF